jgi:phosphoglycolate phosphatase
MIIERNQLQNPVYVGDTEGDGNASREAGIPFVFARYGLGHADTYNKVIDSFEELPLKLK